MDINLRKNKAKKDQLSYFTQVLMLAADRLFHYSTIICTTTQHNYFWVDSTAADSSNTAIYCQARGYLVFCATKADVVQNANGTSANL